MAESYALDIILYLGCIQGLFMSYLLWQKKQSNKRAAHILIFLFLLLSILMFLRVSYTPELLNNYVEIILLPDVILFLIGPMTYFLVLSLLHIDFPGRLLIFLHLLPALIHTVVLNTIVALNMKGTIQTLSEAQIIFIFNAIEAAAIISLIIYAIINIRIFQTYKESFHQRYSTPFIASFLRPFFVFTILTSLLWLIGFLRNLGTVQPDYTIYIIVWFMLAISIYYLGYRIFLSPEVLDLPALRQMEKEPETKEVPYEMINRLEAYMGDQKPFLNPELKIGQLASELEVPKHELSRVINQGFRKNFFEFINTYRIETFIQLKAAPENANASFLELAYQAGFNSKSAFNRAFQKTTGQSPSDYFKKNKALMNRLYSGIVL